MQNTFQSYFKEELSPPVGPSHAPGNNFTRPVNNFLKDPTEIEKELVEEIAKTKEFCICMNGRYVPVSEILSMPMEENY